MCGKVLRQTKTVCQKTKNARKNEQLRVGGGFTCAPLRVAEYMCSPFPAGRSSVSHANIRHFGTTTILGWRTPKTSNCHSRACGSSA